MSAKTIKELSTKIETGKSLFELMPDFPSEQRIGGWVMINETALKEMVIKLADELLKERLDKFFREREEIIEFKKINDSLAQEEITKFILQMKGKGIFKISISDIAMNLNLPPEQIERIMTKFETTGRIKEINE
jgi:hypothetical protein